MNLANFVNYKKVKINNSGVAVTYESFDDDDKSHLITYTCTQEPRVEFYKALKAIASLLHQNYNLKGSLVDAELKEIALKDTEQGTDAIFTFKLIEDDWSLQNRIIQKAIGSDLDTRIKVFLEEVALYAGLSDESKDSDDEIIEED